MSERRAKKALREYAHGVYTILLDCKVKLLDLLLLSGVDLATAEVDAFDATTSPRKSTKVLIGAT